MVAALPIFQTHNRADVIAIRSVAFEMLGASVSERRPLRRNDLCPCGSGKKFKHCHGNYVQVSDNAD